MDFHEPSARMRSLMEAVASRVWLADLRPALRLAWELGGPGMGDAVRAHPERGIDLYRAMVPLAWNQTAAATYGLPDRHPADALTNVPVDQLLQLTDSVARVLDGERTGTMEFRAEAEGGDVVATRFAWSVVGPEDDPLSEVIMVSLDRADLVSEQALRRERRQQLRAALHGSDTTVYMFGSDLRGVWVENARTRPDAGFRGLDPVESFGEEAGCAVAAMFREVLHEGVDGRVEPSMVRDGVTRHFDFTARPWRNAAGLITGVVGTSTDVTEREGLLRGIAESAVTDGLTGLLNRQGLAREMEAPVRQGTSAALIAFDIPGFRAINDTYGNDTGDACLRHVAQVLAGSVGPGDVVSRIGGDQFAVLATDAPAASTRAPEREALRLRSMVEGAAVPVAGGLEIRVPVVVGIASAGGLADGRRSVSDLLSDVDVALSQAKRTRTTVSLIEADARAHRERVRVRLAWGTRVRAALDDGSLSVNAQPIVDLVTGKPAAFELLSRLQGDDGQLVPAATFMPHVQRLGMVPMVDRWMVRRAVNLIARHGGELGDRRLAVNVSATTLIDGDLLGQLDEAAAATGADLSRLAIEVTEVEAIQDRAFAAHVVDGLHSRGALFVLDDFGTGNSAPEYLGDLPVDWIKLDGRFVSRARDFRVDRAIVAAAVAVADALGIPVVAERIEDEQTRDLMREMGVALGQGFLLGRPGEVVEVVGTR